MTPPHSSAPLWPSSRAGAVLTVDLPAIVGNYRLLQERTGDAECAAVVKADAYGLGADRIAKALENAGARTFCVAHVDEGIALRPHLSPNSRILVMHGPRPDAAAACIEYDLCPVLNTMSQIEHWRNIIGKYRNTPPVALQIDSGMSRFGLSAEDVNRISETPSLLEGLQICLIMSHLACADTPSNPANAAQLQQFRGLTTQLPAAPRSLSASSGIFIGDDYHFDLVRPGAALYGIAPNTDGPNPLNQVVRLQAHILQIRDIPEGTGVGYGLNWRAQKASRIAIIAAGYADGMARAGAAQGAAWLGDIRLPMIGRISMDSLAIDISHVPEGLLQEDMQVDLIGPHQTVDDVAAATGTIGYEILTSLGHRYHRAYL